jgi:hypothetical protein
VLRPPVAQDGVTVTPEGQVRLALRHAWSDGTTSSLMVLLFAEGAAAAPTVLYGFGGGSAE